MYQNNIYFRQVELLVKVLPIISRYESFALKGGTAINLFVRDMPRLSVDIDLMYLPIEPREISLENISTTLKKIANDIEKTLGAKVHKLYQMGDDKLTKLLVESRDAKIKIEASPVIRGTVYEPVKMQNRPKVQDLFGFVSTNVVDFHDLYAGKICAALDRQHPRDFFDIRLLLDNEGISEKLMDVFIVYLISSNQPISKLLNPNLIDIKEIYEKQFVGMSVEKIELKILVKTREELIQNINQKLTKNHKEFLLSFKSGTPKWDLLPFSSINELPSVKWKMINLEKMDAKSKKEAIEKLEKILFEN